MPAPLPDPYEKIVWRIEKTTLETLRHIHGDGKVNAVVREVLAQYARHLDRTHGD